MSWKRRAHDEQVKEIKHGFSPLILSTSGGMCMTAIVVYKRITSMIADKYNKSYTAGQCTGSDAKWITFHWVCHHVSMDYVHPTVDLLAHPSPTFWSLPSNGQIPGSSQDWEYQQSVTHNTVSSIIWCSYFEIYCLGLLPYCTLQHILSKPC